MPQVINARELDDFSQKHANARTALARWLASVRAARWQSLADVRETFSRSTDVVDQFTIFNVSGNRVRIITRIDYARDQLFITDVFTHDEYDAWTRRGRH